MYVQQIDTEHSTNWGREYTGCYESYTATYQMQASLSSGITTSDLQHMDIIELVTHVMTPSMFTVFAAMQCSLFFFYFSFTALPASTIAKLSLPKFATDYVPRA
jgi:hypothetical protein